MKMNLVQFSVGITILTLSICPARAGWVQTNGPASGDISTLAIKDSTILAGTFHGGVFRSTNNGGSWTAVNSGLTKMHVNALVVDGKGDIFAGTDFGGVFRSGNNGNSWITVATNLQEYSYVLSLTAIDSSVFVGTDNGAYLFTNTGIPRWTNSGLNNNYIRSLAVSKRGNV